MKHFNDFINKKIDKMYEENGCITIELEDGNCIDIYANGEFLYQEYKTEGLK